MQFLTIEKNPRHTSTSEIGHENINKISLSTYLATEIESGPMLNQNSIKCNPTVKMLKSSTQFQTFTSNVAKYIRKQVAFELRGQKGCTLTVKVTIQLNDISGNLKSGIIIKMIVFKC